MKRKTKEYLSYAALNIVFILLCFITLIPILYAVSVSFLAQALRSQETSLLFLPIRHWKTIAPYYSTNRF